MKNLVMRVAGVTFENRQAILAVMRGFEVCQLRPEPDNAFDRNAIAIYVEVELGAAAVQIGYVPKDLAAQIAPHLDGESLLGHVTSITGGFVKNDGSMASYGAMVRVELPDD